MKKPVFTKLTQACVVVDDLDAYMKRYHDEYGIGPWIVLNFNSETVSDMVVRGKPVNYSMKLALCDALNVQLEIIEPTDDNSVYAEFLKAHGPGLHHLSFDTQGYDQVIEDLASRGIKETFQGGIDAGGMRFTYMDLTKELGFVVELFNPPENFVPPAPERTYPPQE
ncbi:MAG TPA: VOC family protein [Anaerovoracaceae bacterium]|nr:VOC family protein [Anaerovoracaceae bacterium]